MVKIHPATKDALVSVSETNSEVADALVLMIDTRASAAAVRVKPEWNFAYISWWQFPQTQKKWRAEMIRICRWFVRS